MKTPHSSRVDPSRANLGLSAKTCLGILLLASVIHVTGCATARSTPTASDVLPRAPLPPLATLGTIGVISTSTIPKFTFLEPLNRAEAGERVARRIVFLGGDDFTDDTSLLVWQLSLGLAPWVLGAAAVPSRAVAEGFAPSEKSLGHASSSMQTTIAKLNLQDELRTRVVERAASRTALPFKLVQKPLPPGREREFSRMSCVMAGTLAWLPQGRTATDYLSEQGVDTVLELQLKHPGLRGSGSINPSLAICLGVRARLLELGNERELWSCTAQFRSPKHKFTTWANSDAQPFRNELERGLASMADQITDQLVGGTGERPEAIGVELAKD
jgi:hypothetical protein